MLNKPKIGDAIENVAFFRIVTLFNLLFYSQLRVEDGRLEEKSSDNLLWSLLVQVVSVLWRGYKFDIPGTSGDWWGAEGRGNGQELQSQGQG